MTAGFTNNSRNLIGTETVVYRANDGADAVTVEHALFGELSVIESRWFATLAVEGMGLAVELDAADFSVEGTKPVRGGRIERSSDSTAWRIASVRYDHVIGVYRCVLTEVR